MTKPEYNEEQIESLKQCLAKAVSYWLEKTKIDKKRVKFYNSISQTSLNTDIQCNFIILPKPKDENI